MLVFFLLFLMACNTTRDELEMCFSSCSRTKETSALQNSRTRASGEPASSQHGLDKVSGHSTSIQLKYQSHRNDARPEGHVSGVHGKPEPKAP